MHIRTICLFDSSLVSSWWFINLLDGALHYKTAPYSFCEGLAKYQLIKCTQAIRYKLLRLLFVFVKWILICVPQALLHWMEEDQSQTSRSDVASASACQSVLHFPKPTEAFHTSRLWLRRCLTILERDDWLIHSYIWIKQRNNATALTHSCCHSFTLSGIYWLALTSPLGTQVSRQNQTMS